MPTRILLAAVLLAGAALPAADSERQAVIAVVQRLFDAMAVHDAAAIRAVLLPEGRFVTLRENAPAPGTATFVDFANRMGSSTEAIRERMWDPQVLLRGRMAVLWAPYEFQRGGKFSHCGIDTVTLVKIAEGWKIAAFAYTAETTGCPVPPPER